MASIGPRVIGRAFLALWLAALVWLAFALWPTIGATTPGDADSGFSNDGFAFERFRTEDGVDVSALVVQDDAKVVAGITVQYGNGHVAPPYHGYFLIRFEANGTIDQGFGQDGIVDLPVAPGYPDDSPLLVALQSDGGIIVSNANPTENGLWAARYTPAGTLDPDFGGGDGTYSQRLEGSAYAAAGGLAVTSDDRVVLAGGLAPERGEPEEPIVARLNRDGVPDPSFSGDGLVQGAEAGAVGALADVAVDPEQRVIVLGRSSIRSSPTLVRYSPEGSLDTTFASDGAAEIGRVADAFELEVDLLGRPLITAVGGKRQSHIVRLTLGGALDPSFGTGGIATLTYVFTRPNHSPQEFSQLAVDDEGRPLVAVQDHALITGRMTTSGQMDAAYSTNGWARSYVRRTLLNDGPAGDLAVSPTSAVVGATGLFTDRAQVARLELTAGPADADGDSRPNSEERCPFVYGDCPRFKRRAHLSYRRHRPEPFRGEIRLRGGIECDKAPVVKLYRAGAGRDTLISRLRPDYPGAYPDFRFNVRRRPGVYYASVDKTLFDTGICGSARSNRVELE